ncbi:type II toxin-antitoxin system RelE family toxin [Nostoc sp. UHCC 0870]|uniref:type II toxin-antitoxin system RelE family toxin n=1 Tax=Nostoc sp. UHCC 0870 TaxID=2914041 RepID=UPI001EDF211B|nr:hypothetical protein [Nostoc sp. UHCC 0870]UKO97654.1 hypothetical protein L6494_24280 [Nostoc sp. UHCC 0870]
MNSGIESNNQQLKKNQVVLLDKARISLDTLQNKNKEEVIRAIHSLEEFPNFSTIQIHQLKSIPNYFIGRAGIYRIIFDFKPGEITIIDIINHDRLEILYSSLKESEK